MFLRLDIFLCICVVYQEILTETTQKGLVLMHSKSKKVCFLFGSKTFFTLDEMCRFYVFDGWLDEMVSFSLLL